MIKVMEGSKKAGLFSKQYSLAITSVIAPESPIDLEIRHINEAVINWLRSRGKACGFILVVYLSNPDNYPAIIQRTTDLVNQDFEFSALLQSLKISVILADMQGKQQKEFQLGKLKT